MVRFLSTAWLDEFATTAEGLVPPAPTDDSERSLTLRQIVTGGPEGDVVYDLHLGRGRVAVERAPTGEPDVAVEQHHDTALRLARGDSHPQVELTAGRLRISGQANRLTAWRPVLDALDDALGELRAATTW